MSLADVREAFDTLFKDSQITDISGKAYSYDILQDSNFDNRKYRDKHKVNFFIFLVTKTPSKQAFGGGEEIYSVELKYYLQDDKQGIAQNAVRDALETIHSRIDQVIGKNWDSSVDYYLPIQSEIQTQTIQLGGKTSWLGSFAYQGFKKV